jgi:putative ABC transport system permease protein
MGQDLRYGVRMLVKNPGYTMIAALTLALGIGANTAIFTVVNAVLLRPLPYPGEERLLVLRQTRMAKGNEIGGVSYLNFADWRARSRSFESMAIGTTNQGTLTGVGEATRVEGLIVSADFFRTLGIAPQLGRAFEAEDERSGANEGLNSVMLTDSCWRGRFGADPKIVGRKITVDDEQFVIIGVTPPGIIPLRKEPIDFWATAAINGDPNKAGTANGSRGYPAYEAAIARLKPGVTQAQAQAEMEEIVRGMRAEYPASNAQVGIHLISLRTLVVGDARASLWLLLGIVGAVLLIACVNVANLLLVRATVRRREMAIRAALGASRWDIVRQLLVESLFLSLLGGLFGLLLSLWLVEGLMAMLPESIPRIAGLAPDWRVLLFTLAAMLVTGLLCGLVPALAATKVDLSEAVKDGGRSVSAGPLGARMRGALIVLEIAVALVLLTGGGLLVRSLLQLNKVDPGFQTSNVLTMRFALAGNRYQDGKMSPDRINLFLGQLTERVRRIPGVREVGYAQSVPFTAQENSTSFNLVGRPAAKGNEPTAGLRFITPGYLATLGIPLRGGRDLTERDGERAAPVMLINEAFAREYFSGEDPIGRKAALGWGGDAPKEIVGIVGDVLHRGLDDQARPEMYVPQAQWGQAGITLLVRSQVPAAELAPSIRRQIVSLDPELPVLATRTLDEYRSETMAMPRFSAILLAGFAGLALLLTAVGLYGVMAYSVTQRTHEIGIRMTLGAQAGDVLRLILAQGMRLVAIGVALGLLGAFAATRLLKSQLFNVSATDPITFLAIALLLGFVAFLACWAPARRAARVDPMVALKHE